MEWIESHPGEADFEPGEVHVWRFLLAESSREHAAKLSADERARAAAMDSEKARQSFVVSQAALRTVLSGYTDAPPQSLVFSRAARGKPTLAAPAAGPQFNLSHSGEWGVIAVAPFAVGVDVEQIRDERASADVQKRFLTEGERELLARRREAHGDAAFFLIWSRKEAYLKAVGFGLAAPFSRIDSSGERLAKLDENGNQLTGDTPWTVCEFFVDERHPAAVVARARQISLRLYTLGREHP